MTLIYTPLVGSPRTGGVPVVGGPRDWARAGLIGPQHPALRTRGRWVCVQFGRDTICAPTTHFRPETRRA